MVTIFCIILQVITIMLVAPLFDGVARVLRARLQSRKGPPDFFQTYRDIMKYFKRARTTPKCAHWVFTYGPFLFFSVATAILAAIPITYSDIKTPLGYSDIFVIIYLAALLRFFFGIASVDSGNSFAGVGGSREQMLSIFIEPVMIISLLVIMLVAKTSNLIEIQQMVRNGEIGYHIPAFAVASISFLWAMYVETGRNPYDLAEAEQELQEAVLGEYSGSDFVIAHIALVLKQFAMIALFLSIFEPWNFENPILALIVFIFEIGIFYIAMVFIDNFGPRVKLLSGLKSHALAALGVSFIALILYIVEV